jgi:hypothetical protein
MPPSAELEPKTKRTIEVVADIERMIFQRSPLGAIAIGGAWALWKGLFPSFDMREASFGAALLLVAALADMFVWVIKRAEPKRQIQAGQTQLTIIDNDAPGSNK